MWNFLTRIIFRFRLAILILIGLLTLFFGYNALNLKLSYELARMLPSNDPANVDYDDFKQRFGEDGNVFVVGVINKNIYQLNDFKEWYNLGQTVSELNGVEAVVSIARVFNVTKNDSLKKFDFGKVVSQCPQTQQEVDSLKRVIESLYFYKGLLYNPNTKAYLMAITLDKKKLNDKSRVDLVLNIKGKIDNYKLKNKVEIHYSGLPYIRTMTTIQVERELKLFVFISLIIAIVIMLLFFRSIKAIISTILVAGVSVIWAMGIISLFGYKITILTGVLPSLLIIIAIENCIFILNKYHWEIKLHGNKVRAVSTVIRRIGLAIFVTNFTTAVGFGTFILVSNKMLREFGIVSSINVMVEFLISIILIPIFLSYLKPPKEKQTKHLENKFVQKIISKIIAIIFHKRKWIYSICIVFIGLCIYGLTLMKTSGKIVDDLPESDPIYIDLKFFEKNFNGVMPFEISIDTKKKNGVMRLSTIKKIDALQKEIEKYPVFSRPLSIAELVKFSKQAFYNGDTLQYDIPDNMEKDFILSYLPQNLKTNSQLIHNFLDSNKQITRISIQMADLGTKEIQKINKELRPKIDSIFNPKDFNVVVTGNSVVYTKGTDFLIKNLIESVIFGIIMISIVMAIIFSSFRMVLIAMVCNLIPLLVTAAIMGYGNVLVKPSTLIVFSVALGISIDNAILFLSKYRYELKMKKGLIRESVVLALRESGISMIYSAIVLVLGFAVYIVSDFGGTKALGVLISLTLFVALFFNIIVLPALILSLENFITTRSFKKPLMEITDEEISLTDAEEIEEDSNNESSKL